MLTSYFCFPIFFRGDLRFSSSFAEVFYLKSFFCDLEEKLSLSVSKL